MTAKLIKDEFVNEVLSDRDYEGTILRHIFKIINKESISDHIYDHDLYNLICSMRLKNCEILFRSYDFNFKKIEQILGILSDYRGSSIAQLASSLNFIGDVPNDFVTKLIGDAINIVTKIKQLYDGASDKNNWILLEEIFDILKKYLENESNLKNLNIVLNKNLPYRVFVDKTSDFETNYQTQTKFLDNKLFLKPESTTDDSGNEYDIVTNYLNIEEKINIRKTPGKFSEIDDYFKFDLKKIIIIFLKDLPIEFVYLNKILNEPGTTGSAASTAVAINAKFYETMKSFFNPFLNPTRRAPPPPTSPRSPTRAAPPPPTSPRAPTRAAPPPPTSPRAPTRPAPPPPPNKTDKTDNKDLFPELSNFNSINDILMKGNMYDIFKIILSIKIKPETDLKKISYTTLDGDRLCRHIYYNIIEEKINELKAIVNTSSSGHRTISEQRSILDLLKNPKDTINSIITSAKIKIKSKIGGIKNKFYELLIKLIIKYLENLGIKGLDRFITIVRNLTFKDLNFKTIDELISILLNNKNLNNLTVTIKTAQETKIKGKIVGNLCIDYVSYLHYILPIQKNLFKLSLGTNFFVNKFNKMLQECPDNVQQYFKYNKMKIDLMEYIIIKQDLSNLYDGVELALVYLIIINYREPKPSNKHLYQKYMEIDSKKYHYQEALEKIIYMFIGHGFNTEIIKGLVESLTFFLESSSDHPSAFSQDENKGNKITQIEGGNILKNFFINNPYWLGSATVSTLAAVASTAQTVTGVCKKIAYEAFEEAVNEYIKLLGVGFGSGGGKRTRKYRKNQTRKAKRNRYGKNKSHKRKNKNKRKRKTKRS